MIPRPRKRMTIAQLKRHMDRRFSNTRRELQRSATKNDLRRFATKKDLQRFATKEDVRRFASKQDLRRFATKKDLQRFATKDDFRGLEMRMNTGFGEVTRRFESLDSKMDSLFSSLKEAIAERDRLFDEHEVRIRDLEAGTAS